MYYYQYWSHISGFIPCDNIIEWVFYVLIVYYCFY